jgi:uncharacterized membrane protein YagU involved in acid resistance
VAVAETIAWSGGVAGVLDLCATGSLMLAQGVPVRRMLQFIASGALGQKAFEGGTRTAATGLALHFLVAGIWAVAYFIAGGWWPAMLEEPWLYGALFGVVVHLVMSLVVVPLSRAPGRPFAWKAWLMQLAIHVVCVGVPIAVVQSHLLR